uniref:FRY microtubule binding protein n=1 Tax=Molossus molossus TaxID=27622 RepID=A0A7J8FXJ6_MOLMO|nr:FRY microtubule binding protein [Molossus molossus]
MANSGPRVGSRTKNKLQSAQNDCRSSRRSSLPPELLLGHDARGRLQRNVRNLEPVHLRRPKKRPSIFPGSSHTEESYTPKCRPVCFIPLLQLLQWLPLFLGSSSGHVM